MIDLLIVDDHPSFCESLAEAINGDSELRVIDYVSSAGEAMDILKDQMVDVVIFDINLGENQMNGIEAAKEITQLYPSIEVLLFSWNLQVNLIDPVIFSGAASYVEKQSIPEIISSIKKVYNGQKFYRFTAICNEDYLEPEEIASRVLLSSKEQQILHLMMEGFDESEIMQKMYCLYATFRIHKRNLMAKLNALNDKDLLRKAIHKKLIRI